MSSRPDQFEPYNCADSPKYLSYDVQETDAHLYEIWILLPEWARVWVRQIVLGLAVTLHLVPEEQARQGQVPLVPLDGMSRMPAPVLPFARPTTLSANRARQEHPSGPQAS